MNPNFETHKLTKREYEELHAIVSRKRAVKEMMQTLHIQLAGAVRDEDIWWSKLSKKHELDAELMSYTVDHETQSIIGVEKPKQQNRPGTVPHNERPPANVPQGAIVAKPVVPYQEDTTQLDANVTHDRQRKQSPPREDFLDMEKLVKEFEANRGL